MNNGRQNGFVLMLVIIVMALIAVQMLALADIANTMQFQSHTEYLSACERNLLASGTAWAKQNVRDMETADKKRIELDVGRINIRNSALDVTISTSPDGRIQVKINTSCTRGRQTFKGDRNWTPL
jgi:type II secretory pathway component PulK